MEILSAVTKIARPLHRDVIFIIFYFYQVGVQIAMMMKINALKSQNSSQSGATKRSYTFAMC